MILLFGASNLNAGARLFGWTQNRRQVETVRFPVRDCMICRQTIGATYHVVDTLEAQLGHDFTSILCHHKQIVDHVFGFTGKLGSEFWVLSGYANGASVQVAFPHHNAAQSDQGSCRKAKLLSPKQRGHHNVATCFETAVGL